MEKVKVDTEVRKLDQLRAAHVNQQHSIRLQLHRLPLEIAEAQRGIATVAKDIAMRDGHTDTEFSMTVGNRVYSGKGAREEAAKALTYTVLSWRDDTTVQVRGAFRGFEILSKGNSELPDLFLRGAGTYPAHLNPENTLGTVQSIEHTLRPWKESPRNNRSAPITCKRRSPITRPRRTDPLSMKSALRNCLCVRPKSMLCWTSTKASDRLRKGLTTGTILRCPIRRWIAQPCRALSVLVPETNGERPG
jgi:hypothetical protein